MSESVFRRRPIQLLLLGALLFIIASAVPPVVISQMRPLEAGVSQTYSTRPNDTLSLLAPLSGTAGVPEPHRGRPECAAGEYPQAPYSCFVVDTTSHRTTDLETRKGPDTEELAVDARTQVTVDGDVLAELDDEVILDARSAFPVPDPVSRMALSLPEPVGEVQSDPFVREGLQYYFPFPTGRQSYPLFDPVSRRELLLDYVGETERNGIDTYEFHHRFVGLEVPRDLLGDTSGPGTPRLSVDRTVWVEPESGTIIDILVDTHLYFAADDRETGERAFSPSPDHTIFHTVSTWDEDTLARQADHAASDLSTLRFLQVMAVGLKGAALIVVIAAVVLLLRERREP